MNKYLEILNCNTYTSFCSNEYLEFFSSRHQSLHEVLRRR